MITRLLSAKLLFLSSCLLLLSIPRLSADNRLLEIGVAKIDITPDYPIRLSGYGARTTESDGIDLPIHAKALAIGGNNGSPLSLFITVDNTGVPEEVTEAAFQKIQTQSPLRRENFVIASSHTHTAPMLTGILPFLFSSDIPEHEQATISRYTAELTENIKKVALAAIADRKPASLSFGSGTVTFAKNRREPNGPADHSLPFLAIHSPDGNLRAILANYACHCTTLSHNKIHGDWAGEAQNLIETDHPGSIAMISIGAGADSNPHPRGSLDLARRHGAEIAAEISRLLKQPLSPITTAPIGSRKSIELPFIPLPTRSEWETKAATPGIVGYHARKNLDRLDRGETLPAKLPYTVQEWHFGNQLAMVFLPGEVVVDYALRLKNEFNRLWVTAYANDVPCYIPSERVLSLANGPYNYEGAFAMHYYDRPARFAPGVESLIISAVHEIIPETFLSTVATAKPASASAAESVSLIHKPENLVVELVAAEPLVIDPVAIDFGPDGKLWVVEMRDYPTGIDGNWKPGGRVKFLTDTNGDGIYDKATVFIDDLPFPTGVLAYKNGVLICAAPDILYAEDTDGDGKADLIEKLFSGFATENYQARVNGLSYGLDNWIYGANGLLGGTISGSFGGKPVDIRGRDFRMHPDTGEFEAVAGLTQQGRVRDDFGNWFGSDNSNVGWHYPLPEHYLRRNPNISPPGQRLTIGADPDPRRIYPTSETLERFNQPGHANRLTSACGETIYRDTLLGHEMYGDYFLTEPVHNLVHRLRLRPNGISFAGNRLPSEKTSEFFSSSDNWSRPVQVRTGPDGAIWVVDMVRAVIEHPRWISPAQLAKLDIRAGDNLGRIYRIYPADKKLRPIPDFTKMSSAELVAELDTPNGPRRDLIQRLLIERKATETTESLQNLATTNDWPATRVQALWTLNGLGTLTPEILIPALTDPSPGLRQNALRLSETFLPKSEKLAETVLTMVSDPDPQVRFQLALSLGEWNDRRTAPTLGELALAEMADPWFQSAILSSSSRFPAEILTTILTAPDNTPGRNEMISGLIASLASLNDKASITSALKTITESESETAEPSLWQLSAVTSLIEALDRTNLPIPEILAGSETDLQKLIDLARNLAFNQSTPAENRIAALRLLGTNPDIPLSDLQNIIPLLTSADPDLLNSLLILLQRQSSPEIPGLILENWSQNPPALRSRLIDLLLGRENWSLSLLEAIRTKKLSGTEISPPNQERLFNHPNTEIRNLAKTELNRFRPADRAKVIAAYSETATLTGRIPFGAKVFQNNCAACHSFRGTGIAFGPDVGLFRDKNISEFLEAILDPNAVIEPRFITYLIETKNGRNLAGVIAAETANSLTITQMGGTSETLLRSDVTRIEAFDRSLMPEGLEREISPQQMADLIAFLRSSDPRPFNSATPESAKTARAEFLKPNATRLNKLISAAEQLDYPGWLGTLPMALARQVSGKNSLVWQSDPVPENLPLDRMHPFLFPAAMGNFLKPAAGFTLRIDGKTELHFDVSLDDQVWENDSQNLRLSYEIRERNRSDGSGPLTIEIAPELLSPGKPVTFEILGAEANSPRWFGIYLLSDDQLPTDSRPLATQILDASKPAAVRDRLIQENPDKSAEILSGIIDGIETSTPAEYRRIPWIWKLTLAAGLRKNESEILEILKISLPVSDQPLTDWQAVVIGGGIINGITQANEWPKTFIENLLQNDPVLRRRWHRSLLLASKMADNPDTPAGTRYDALRMIALLPPETCMPQLLHYLLSNDQNLQQGAVSGLGDLDSPDAATALIQNFNILTPSNQKFAAEALIRTEERKTAFKTGISTGIIDKNRLDPNWLSENLR